MAWTGSDKYGSDWMGLDWIALHGTGQDNNWAGLGLAGLGCLYTSSLFLPPSPSPRCHPRRSARAEWLERREGWPLTGRCLPPPERRGGHGRAGAAGVRGSEERDRERESLTYACASLTCGIRLDGGGSCVLFVRLLWVVVVCSWFLAAGCRVLAAGG